MPHTGERPGTRAGPEGARLTREQRQGLAVAISAVAAPIAAAAPIGVTLLDVAWSALIAGVAAYLGSTAKRGPLLVASIVAVLASRSVTAGIFAALAIAFAALATRHLRRRAFFARGMAGGALAISVLATGATQPAWLTLLAAAGVGAAITASGYRNTERTTRKHLRWAAAAFVAFVALGSAGALAGAAASAHRIDVGTNELEAGLTSAQQGDAAGAASHLQTARVALHRARTYIDGLGALGRLVPLTAQHVDAMSSVLDEVDQAADQGITTAQATDMHDLTIEAGRIDVQAIADLQNPFRQLSMSLASLVADVHERLRSPLVPAFKHRLSRLGDQAARAQHAAFLGSEGARTMPSFLGGGGVKRYLVLFTSPSEARGRFGFPASFAEVTMDNGRFLLGEHGATSAFLSKVTADQTAFDSGSDQLRPYLLYGPTRQMLSVTVPPDFTIDAKDAATFWAASGREPVDGVIRFDPTALAALMAFTGPVDIATVPQPLTALNLEQFLVFGQYVQFPTDQAPRREVLQNVADLTFERLVVANLPSPRQLIDAFSPLVKAGHLQVTSFDADTAALLGEVGTDGRFAPPVQDGVMVSNINSGGNKIDAFLTKSISYDAHVDKRHLTGSVDVTLTNHAPDANLPFYVIGSSTKPPLPKGTNRTTVLIYTAVAGDRVLLDGQPVATTPALRTGGWWLEAVALDLAPGATHTIRVEVDGDLPHPDQPYHLDLLPGGGTTPDQYAVQLTAPDGQARFSGAVPTPTRVS